MTSRSGKLSAAYRTTWDERAQLAEELIATIDHDDRDGADDADLDWRRGAEAFEPRYAADEDGPVSDDRWQSAPMRLSRSS